MRDQEDLPTKGAHVSLDDDEDSDDAPRRGRNKETPNGIKMEKDKKKRSAESET